MDTKYRVCSQAFVCDHAQKRMNRALYGKYDEKRKTRLRVLSGELPELLLFHRKNRGRMFFQIEEAAGGHRLLSDMKQISAGYKDGHTWQDIQDPSFSGRIHMTTVPDTEHLGAWVCLELEETQQVVSVTALFGAAGGEISPRAMDAGYYSQDDPQAGILYLPGLAQDNLVEASRGVLSVAAGPQGEECAWLLVPDSASVGTCDPTPGATGFDLAPPRPRGGLGWANWALQPGVPVYLWVGCEPVPAFGGPDRLARHFQNALRHYEQLAERMILHTPDPLLDAAMRAACVATEGYWLDPVFAHGAWSWDLPLAGWRSLYGPIVLGMRDRVMRQAQYFTDRQLCADGKLRGEDTLPPDQRAAACGVKLSGNTKGCPDPEWDLARQSADSVFMSEGVMPYTAEGFTTPIYNMQEVFVDQLLHARRYWGDAEWDSFLYEPVAAHLRWEKRCFERQNTGLYENFANFWASDGVYSGGAVGSLATAYNYRANRDMVFISRRLGKDESAYVAQAQKIRESFRKELWMDAEGSPAECRDTLGEGLLHPSFSIPTMVHCAESGLLDEKDIRRMLNCAETQLERQDVPGGKLMWNTNWAPYLWSVRDIDFADLFHLALTYFRNAQPEKGYELLCGALTQSACNTVSPGAFMCVYEGKSVDFADTVSLFIRCVYEGLYGVDRDMPRNHIQVAPAFPSGWDQAEITGPDFSYRFRRTEKGCRMEIQNPKKATLSLAIPARGQRVAAVLVNGRECAYSLRPFLQQERICVEVDPCARVDVEIRCCGAVIGPEEKWAEAEPYQSPVRTLFPRLKEENQQMVDMDAFFNGSIGCIFEADYLSPRPQTCSLQIPRHLVPANWCWVHAVEKLGLDDSPLRRAAEQGVVRLPGGLQFRQPKEGRNVCFVSRWNIHPHEVTIPVGKKGTMLYLLVVVYTNAMQCGVPNFSLDLVYRNNRQKTFDLVAPQHLRSLERGPETERPCDAWCYRHQQVDRFLIAEKTADPEHGGVFAQVVGVPLEEELLAGVTIRARANEVVAGLMGLTVL